MLIKLHLPPAYTPELAAKISIKVTLRCCNENEISPAQRKRCLLHLCDSLSFVSAELPKMVRLKRHTCIFLNKYCPRSR